ncbi:hypothetical protein O181_087767 [Austropuccinia psidii MF-1]|uniref:Uncharacterized protein n=1 Tax=Austropuccinia psidii MF-1 TaxID=1389203 RepID=A0A9Q3IQA4_9BASI|nr:hypothetical protein [Austropuccinia psidii MF-1]
MIYNLLQQVEEMELQIQEKSPSNNIKNKKVSKAQTDHSHSVEKPQPSIGSSNLNSTSSKKKKLEKKIQSKKRYSQISHQVKGKFHIKCDDEFYSKKEFYISQRLPFQSEAANIFFCKLDEKIKATNDAKNHSTNPRTQVHIKDPPLTHFPKAPEGLPLDFYDPKWFNSKLPAQRKNLADVGTVAFLKDPTDSLEFKVDDERLGNKRFTNRNWERAIKKSNQEEQNEEEKTNEVQEKFNSNDKGKGKKIENGYDEFDDDAMEIETSRQSGYVGGLTEKEWNAWQ